MYINQKSCFGLHVLIFTMTFSDPVIICKNIYSYSWICNLFFLVDVLEFICINNTFLGLLKKLDYQKSVNMFSIERRQQQKMIKVNRSPHLQAKTYTDWSDQTINIRLASQDIKNTTQHY